MKRSASSTPDSLVRRSHPRGPRQPGWLVETPVYLLLVFTPLAIGTAHLWSQAVMLGGSVAAFTALLLRRRQIHVPIKIFPMGLALLAVSALTLLQILPVPGFLIRVLNPGAAELFDLVLSGTGLWGESNWRALSLDPPATSRELLKFVSYALIFIVIVNYFNRQHRARQLLKVISWGGFVVALTGLLSKLAGLSAIYGIHPVPPGTFFFSTFVNSNHLAGFLGLCAPVSFGLSLSSRSRQGRYLYGFLGIIAAVGVFMSLSRGGIVAFLLGCIFLCIYATTRRVWKLKQVVLVQAVVAVVLSVAGYLAYNTIIAEMKTLGDVEAIRTSDKIRGWEGALPMMKDHPVVGIGRGAYSTVYPRYQTTESTFTYTHAENGVLQNMVEWGPIFGLLFMGAFVLVFFLGMRRARSSYGMGGCLTAIFTLALHNLVDFNLEMGGVALPFVVLLGVISASPFSHSGRPLSGETRLRLPSKLAHALVPAFVLAGAGCVLHAWAHDIDKGTEALLARTVFGACEPCSETPMGNASCEMLRHHPADYLTPLAIGKAYLEKRPRNLSRAVYWLSRAVYLNPNSAMIRRLTGRALFLAGNREQALMEYRQGVERDPTSLAATVSEVLKLTKDHDSTIQVAPERPETYLDLAHILKNLGRCKAASKAARLALDLDSSLLGALDLLGEIELTQGRPDEALRLARQTIEMYPRHDAAYDRQGRAYFAMDDEERGEKSWLAGFDQAPDSVLLAQRLGNRYLSQGRIRKAEDIINRLDASMPRNACSRASLHALLARILEFKGDLYEAGRSYRDAAALMPESAIYMFHVGRIEQRMGNWDDAERIFEQLLREDFEPGEMRSRLEYIRASRNQERHDAMWNGWAVQKERGEHGFQAHF